MKQYSTVIADALKSFMDELDMNYMFDEDAGYFRFIMQFSKNIMRPLRYLVVIRNSDYIINAFCPIGIDPEDPEIRRTLSEYFCRINEKLCNGSFVLDFSDGSILFRIFVDCTEISQPTEKSIERSFFLPAGMFNGYGRGIIDIVYNGSTAEKAASCCESLYMGDIKGSADSKAVEEDIAEQDKTAHIKTDPFKKGGKA